MIGLNPNRNPNKTPNGLPFGQPPLVPPKLPSCTKLFPQASTLLQGHALAATPPHDQPKIVPFIQARVKSLKVTIRPAHQALTSINFSFFFSQVNFTSLFHNSTTKSAPPIHPTPPSLSSQTCVFSSSISKSKPRESQRRVFGSLVFLIF